MPTTDLTIAANIKAELARATLSQGVLADILDVSQAGVSMRLRGLTPWRAVEVVHVAEALHVPLSSLLRVSDEVTS